MSTYRVDVTREGKWWMVAIPELDDLTQARRIGEAELMAREVIALRTGAALDDIEVDMHIDVDDISDAAARAEKIRAERREAERLEQQALTESKALARELADRNVPVRDIGELLGVTFQRASQLVNS
jgi:hypothetical protein